MEILTINGWLGKGDKWIWEHLQDQREIVFHFLGYDMGVNYQTDTFGGLLRYSGKLFTMALNAFFIMRRYDVLVSSHLSFGVPLSVLRGITGCVKPPLHIVHFIIHERMRRHRFFLRTALSGVTSVICHSRYEVEHYPKILEVDPRKFLFVPLGINTDVFRPTEKYQNDQGYILAIGQESRDYRTFFESVKNLPYPVFVITSESAISGLEIPETVTIYPWLSSSDFKQAIAGARCIAVPLNEVNYSSGQRGFLSAMASGKAVVVTKTVGSVDYIEDGQTGMLYDPGDAEGLREAIRVLMEDPRECQRIGALARIRVEKDFSESVFAKRIFAIINNQPDA